MSWDQLILTHAYGAENKADIDSIFGSSTLQRNVSASIALRLADIAVGRSHVGVTTHRLAEWDIAAGDAICREAGYSVTDLNGGAITYNNSDPTIEGLIAATGGHHAATVRLCNNAGFSGEARGTRAW